MSLPADPAAPSGPGRGTVATIGGAARDSGLFERFAAGVARAQLAEWLPEQPQLILDLSHQCAGVVGLMLERGHTVVHAEPALLRQDIVGGSGRMFAVRADPRSVDWLAPGSVDAVVAEGGTLSDALAVECTLDDLRRVLRRGGRLLLAVDSLVAGLSVLADQGRWAELADVPAADVVLVPREDGTFSRCYWPEELHGLLAAAGFDVEWIRPRTVLAEETVVRALRVNDGQLPSLVETEMALARRRQGESIGARLVASAIAR